MTLRQAAAPSCNRTRRMNNLNAGRARRPLGLLLAALEKSAPPGARLSRTRRPLGLLLAALRQAAAPPGARLSPTRHLLGLLLAALEKSAPPGARLSRTRRPLGPLLAALLLTLAAPPGAAAADFEEMIVTAQKREESVQDVGITITAFSAEQMETFGFTNSMEIAAFTPGMYVSGDNAGQTSQFTIRGVTQNDVADLHEGPNAVYVDEAYVATSQGQLFANFDMERVEVLKGPQGTLFGRNATGGLVHFITARPTAAFESYADAAYGSYDSVRFEGAVSGPLSAAARGRLAGFFNRFGPIWENVFPDQLPSGYQGSEAGAADVWELDQFALRGQLEMDLGAAARLWLKGHYAERNPGSGAYQSIPTVAYVDDTDGDGAVDDLLDTRFADDVRTTCEQVHFRTGACVASTLDQDGNDQRPGPVTDFFGYDDRDGEGPTTSTDHVVSDYNRIRTYGFTASLGWELDNGVALTSISSYSEQDKRHSLDVDGGPAPQFLVVNESAHNWFTQELRLHGALERLEWVAGLYYLSINAEYNAALTDTRGGLNVFGAGPHPFGADNPNLNADAGVTSRLKTDSYSVFGQVDLRTADRLTLIAGARLVQEEKEFSYTNRLYENLDDRTVDNHTEPITLSTGGIEFFPPHDETPSSTLWSAKLGLNYAAANDLLLYATLNRGVKAGSCNAPFLTLLAPEQYCYADEVLLAYEAGFKATLPAGGIRINGAAFYYDYNDYQAYQFIGTSGAILNADAEYYGAELDLAAAPLENLTLALGASWTHARIHDLEVAADVTRDVKPAFTPDWQASGLARYAWPAALQGGDLALQLDFSYASAAFFNINNFGTHKMDGYAVGNARLDWSSPDGRLELQLFVNNLADARYQTVGFELSTICGCDERAYGLPRWFGGRIRYNFRAGGG